MWAFVLQFSNTAWGSIPSPTEKCNTEQTVYKSSAKTANILTGSTLVFLNLVHGVTLPGTLEFVLVYHILWRPVSPFHKQLVMTLQGSRGIPNDWAVNRWMAQPKWLIVDHIKRDIARSLYIFGNNCWSSIVHVQAWGAPCAASRSVTVHKLKITND